MFMFGLLTLTFTPVEPIGRMPGLAFTFILVFGPIPGKGELRGKGAIPACLLAAFCCSNRFKASSSAAPGPDPGVPTATGPGAAKGPGVDTDTGFGP